VCKIFLGAIEEEGRQHRFGLDVSGLVLAGACWSWPALRSCLARADESEVICWARKQRARLISQLGSAKIALFILFLLASLDFRPSLNGDFWEEERRLIVGGATIFAS